MAGRARIGLRVLPQSLDGADDTVNLRLDLIVDDRRLPALLEHLQLLRRELVTVVVAACRLGLRALIGLIGPVILMAADQRREGREITVPLIRGREARHARSPLLSATCAGSLG
jgi:hypothetical protein